MIRWIARRFQKAGWHEAAVMAASLHGAIDCFGIFGLVVLLARIKFKERTHGKRP